MPPASRNQRVPRAGATPTPAAASSLERPAAINTQNWRRSSRRATEGRPGDRNAPRRHRSERRLRGSTATSLVEVLRRPLDPAQRGGVAAREVCPRRAAVGHEEGVADEGGVAHQVGAAGGRVARRVEDAGLLPADREGLAILEQVVELGAVRVEGALEVEYVLEDALHLGDPRADTDLAAQVPLEVTRGRE